MFCGELINAHQKTKKYSVLFKHILSSKRNWIFLFQIGTKLTALLKKILDFRKTFSSWMNVDVKICKFVKNRRGLSLAKVNFCLQKSEMLQKWSFVCLAERKVVAGSPHWLTHLDPKFRGITHFVENCFVEIQFVENDFVESHKDFWNLLQELLRQNDYFWRSLILQKLLYQFITLSKCQNWSKVCFGSLWQNYLWSSFLGHLKSDLVRYFTLGSMKSICLMYLCHGIFDQVLFDEVISFHVQI